MEESIRRSLDALRSDENDLQNQAFQHLLATTATPVDWACDAWDELLESVRHKDNRRRAIAAQILCNLAKSDPNRAA